MTNEDLLNIAFPIIEDFSTMQDLKYIELQEINQNLGVLIELLTEIETKNTDFRDEVYNYINREEIEEVEQIETEEIETQEIELFNVELLENSIKYEQSNNEYLATIASNTEPIQTDEEIERLDLLSKSAILVILVMITIFGVFYFVRYVFNMITKHF